MMRWIAEDSLEHVPELLWGEDRAATISRMVDSCEEVERVELVAFDGERCVGICVMGTDYDCNVGPSLSIAWNFVLPEYRGIVGQRFLRRAFRLCAELCLPTLAYTHRIGEGEYVLKYRRIHG